MFALVISSSVSSINNSNIGCAVIGRYPVDAQHERKATFNLKLFLNKLEISFRSLHTAGNDAHFTLKALLILAVQSMTDVGTKLNPDQEEIPTKLQAIGHASIATEPSWRTPDEQKYRAWKCALSDDEKRSLRL